MGKDTTFKRDLAVGQEAEKYAAEVITSIHKQYITEFNESKDIEKLRDYDFKLTGDGKELTFEVKADAKEANTGNLFMEYKSRGKVSGIYRSISDFIVFVLKAGTMLIFNRQALLSYLELNKSRFKTVGTMHSNTQGILVPSKDIRNELPHKLYEKGFTNLQSKNL